MNAIRERKPKPRPGRWTPPDPDHVIGPRWLELVRDPDDPRLWLPKPIRWMGLTINLGHPQARFWIAGFVLVLIAGISLIVA